jgi:GAF domain-containing protein
MHFWEGSERLFDLTELPVEQSACGFVRERQQPMVWPDLQLETRFQRAVSLLAKKGVRSYCTLPLTTAQKRFGAPGWEVLVLTHTTTMICISCGELPN